MGLWNFCGKLYLARLHERNSKVPLLLLYVLNRNPFYLSNVFWLLWTVSIEPGASSLPVLLQKCLQSVASFLVFHCLYLALVSYYIALPHFWHLRDVSIAWVSGDRAGRLVDLFFEKICFAKKRFRDLFLEWAVIFYGLKLWAWRLMLRSNMRV